MRLSIFTFDNQNEGRFAGTLSTRAIP